jgi:Domain of unknown function (DUF1937)
MTADIKVVYICGPYRAADPWTCEQHVRRAEALAYEVAQLGAMPLCPHANTRPYFAGAQGDAFWLAGTLEVMRRCDAVALVEGWERSEGSVGEVRAAAAAQIPVFAALEDLARWLRQLDLGRTA